MSPSGSGRPKTYTKQVARANDPVEFMRGEMAAPCVGAALGEPLASGGALFGLESPAPAAR